MFKNSTFLSTVTKQHDRALSKWIGHLGWPLRQIIHNVCLKPGKLWLESTPYQKTHLHTNLSIDPDLFLRAKTWERVLSVVFFCNIIMLQLPPQTQGHWYQGKPHGIVPSFRWVICALWKALSGLTVSVSRPSEPVGMPSTPHPMHPQNKILCDFDFAEGPDNLYHIRLNIFAQLTIE